MITTDEERVKQIAQEYGELIRRQIELQKDFGEFCRKWKILKPELPAKN
jgi:hypothetical protein